jgi:hypothetical protein
MRRQRTLREVLALNLEAVEAIPEPLMTEATRQRLQQTFAHYKSAKGGEQIHE